MVILMYLQYTCNVSIYNIVINNDSISWVCTLYRPYSCGRFQCCTRCQCCQVCGFPANWATFTLLELGCFSCHGLKRLQ